MHGARDVVEAARTCVGCGSAVDEQLGSEVWACTSCRCVSANCSHCGYMEALTSQHCSHCGERQHRDGDGMLVTFQRFDRPAGRRIAHTPCLQAPVPNMAGQEPHLGSLFGAPVVWAQQSGVVLGLATPTCQRATPPGCETADMQGPPTAWKPDGAVAETGLWVLQVGRERLSIWPGHCLSDVSFGGRVDARKASVVRAASDLGFAEFLPVFGWLDAEHFVVVGTERGNPRNFAISVVSVLTEEHRPAPAPRAGSPFHVGQSGPDGAEWCGTILLDPEYDLATIAITRGGHLWLVRVKGERVEAGHAYALHDTALRRAELVASLQRPDHTSFVVRAVREELLQAEPTTWLERWILRPDGAISVAAPLYGKQSVTVAREFRASGNRLLAVLDAASDGSTRFQVLGSLEGQSWCSMKAEGQTRAPVRAIGPDYVAAVGSFVGQRYLLIAPVTRRASQGFTLSEALGPHDPTHRLQLVACPTSVTLLVRDSFQVIVKQFPIERTGSGG